MATFIYDSFKGHLLSGNIRMVANPIYVALLSGTYVPDDGAHTRFADVSGYEAIGSGYTRSGKVISSPTVTVVPASNWAYWDGANVTWSSSTLTASGAVIYASGLLNGYTDPLIGYVDFGSSLSSSNGDFTITWSDNGIVRIANA